MLAQNIRIMYAQSMLICWAIVYHVEWRIFFMLDINAFEAYLEQLPRDHAIIVRDGRKCPIAEWLKHSSPQSAIYVSSFLVDVTLYWGEPTERFYAFSLPDWGSRFVQEIDKRKEGYVVTVQEALDIIRAIRTELELQREKPVHCSERWCIHLGVTHCARCERALCLGHAHQLKNTDMVVCYRCIIAPW
jgi:hypothetical protein